MNAGSNCNSRMRITTAFFHIGLPNTDLEDIRDVMDELRDVLACYYGIGEMLRLPNNKLEETCGQNLSAADAMRKVITEWLKRNYNSSRFRPPTWKALVDAVEHPAGGNNKAEAEKIALRHKKGEYRCWIPYNKQVKKRYL